MTGISGTEAPAAVLADGALAQKLAFPALRGVLCDPAPALASEIAPEELGDRVAIVAPHPDDEIANAGGLIRRVRESGAQVKVVLLTSGDGYRMAARRLGAGRGAGAGYLALGSLRAAESLEAALALGLGREDVAFLGYPDGRLERLLEAERNGGAPIHGAHGRAAVPYESAFRPGAPFRARDLVHDLAMSLAGFAPTTVVCSSTADTHADHRAAAVLCRRALGLLGFRGLRLGYLTHAGHYPFPWAYLPEGYLIPPMSLRASREWLSLPLDQVAIDHKELALRPFASQCSLAHMGVYLRSFVRRNELFIEERD